MFLTILIYLKYVRPIKQWYDQYIARIVIAKLYSFLDLYESHTLTSVLVCRRTAFNRRHAKGTGHTYL